MKDRKIAYYKAYKPSRHKIKTFPQLRIHLALLGIRPQEALDIINNSKRQYNVRYYWTMTRIAFYVNERRSEYLKKIEERLPIVGMELRKYKNKYSSRTLFKDLSFSKRSKFYQAMYRKLLKTSKKDRKKIAEKMYYVKLSKKINTCKKVVDSNEFKEEFKNFYPFEKFDARKEVQNLNKLITEKRHQGKLTNGSLDIAVNKAMKEHAAFCRNYKDKKFYSYPGKYLREAIFNSIGISFEEDDIEVISKKIAFKYNAISESEENLISREIDDWTEAIEKGEIDSSTTFKQYIDMII